MKVIIQKTIAMILAAFMMLTGSVQSSATETTDNTTKVVKSLTPIKSPTNYVSPETSPIILPASSDFMFPSLEVTLHDDIVLAARSAILQTGSSIAYVKGGVTGYPKYRSTITYSRYDLAVCDTSKLKSFTTLQATLRELFKDRNQVDGKCYSNTFNSPERLL